MPSRRRGTESSTADSVWSGCECLVSNRSAYCTFYAGETTIHIYAHFVSCCYSDLSVMSCTLNTPKICKESFSIAEFCKGVQGTKDILIFQRFLGHLFCQSCHVIMIEGTLSVSGSAVPSTSRLRFTEFQFSCAQLLCYILVFLNKVISYKNSDRVLVIVISLPSSVVYA